MGIKELIKFIDKEIVRQGRSQNQVLEKAGLKSSYIPNLRKNVKEPASQNLIKLSRSLKIHPSILFQKMGWLPQEDPLGPRGRLVKLIEKLPEKLQRFFIQLIEAYAEKYIDESLSAEPEISGCDPGDTGNSRNQTEGIFSRQSVIIFNSFPMDRMRRFFSCERRSKSIPPGGRLEIVPL